MLTYFLLLPQASCARQTPSSLLYSGFPTLGYKVVVVVVVVVGPQLFTTVPPFFLHHVDSGVPSGSAVGGGDSSPLRAQRDAAPRRGQVLHSWWSVSRTRLSRGGGGGVP